MSNQVNPRYVVSVSTGIVIMNGTTYLTLRIRGIPKIIGSLIWKIPGPAASFANALS